MSTEQHANAAHAFRLSDVSTLTARLAQLMAEEVDYLNEMKLSKIEALQSEKQFLVNALDAQKKLAMRNPDIFDTIPSQDKDEFRGLVDVFNDILEENHRKLQLARDVNNQVVKAITKVVKDHASSRYYNGQGASDVGRGEVLSVTLNKTI